MAVTQIDEFSFPSSFSGTENYKIFFNDHNSAISVVYSGVDGEAFSVFEAQRGRAEGDIIPGTPGINIFKASLLFPFAYLDGEEPLPPVCDLLVSVSKTDETGEDYNDGTAIVFGSSAFPPIDVSLDGVNWLPSPQIYEGLAPNNYTAYARDDNGCSDAKAFAIEQFDNPIDGGYEGGLPQVEIPGGNISRWNAAFNPIVISFQNNIDESKKNFHYEVEITSTSGVIVGNYTPNKEGFTRCDISGYLKTLVNANDNFKYDVLNWRDLDRSASFTIRYRQVWDDGEGIWYSAPQPLYVTYSAKQLGDKYGGNMAEYVTFFEDPNPDHWAKWLTDFDTPTAWDGLPFDNSFILSEYLVTKEIKLRTISLDVNGNPIGAGELNSFILNNDNGYVLGEDLSRLIIQKGSLPVLEDDDILDGLGINRLMLAGSPSPGVKYFQIQLYSGSDAAPKYITQPLNIKIEKPCKGPKVYIKWLNTLGGWDYWLFEKDNITSISTANDIQIDRNVFDWENADTIADLIKKSAAKRINIGATVSMDDAAALEGIYTSIKVMMMTSLQPIKWQTVIVNNGTFETNRAKLAFLTMKFAINLPEINIQQQ